MVIELMRVVAIESLQLPRDKVYELFNEIVGGGAELVLYDDKPSSEDELVSRVRDANVIITVSHPISRRVIESASKLRMIAVSFTGYDHIDLQAARERGVVVSNVPGYATESVAELVFGFLIAAYRRLLECDRIVRSGGWRTEGLFGREVRGKVMGVVGFGSIGRRVAELAKCFGMKVIAYDRSPWKTFKKEAAEKLGVEFTSLEELFRRADVVSIHVPLTSETRGMIRLEHLRMLKENAVLINTARGAVIDEEGLRRFLEERKDVTICLDVYWREPPVGRDWLFKAENVILTPHVGFYTREAIEYRVRVTMENIKAFMKGRPKNVVS